MYIIGILNTQYCLLLHVVYDYLQSHNYIMYKAMIFQVDLHNNKHYFLWNNIYNNIKHYVTLYGRFIIQPSFLQKWKSRTSHNANNAQFSLCYFDALKSLKYRHFSYEILTKVSSIVRYQLRNSVIIIYTFIKNHFLTFSHGEIISLNFGALCATMSMSDHSVDPYRCGCWVKHTRFWSQS